MPTGFGHFHPYFPSHTHPISPTEILPGKPFPTLSFLFTRWVGLQKHEFGFFSAAWAILSTTTPLKTTVPLPRDPLTNHSLLVSNGVSWALLSCMMKWRWSNLVPVTAVAEITRKSLVLSRRQHFTSVLPFLQLVHSVSLSCCSCVLERIIQRSYLECIVNSHLFLVLWPLMGFCVNWCPGPKKKTLMMRADKMPNLCCLTQEKRKSMQMRSLSWCCQNFMFCHGSSCNASFFSWYLLLLPTAALAEPANRVPLVRWEKFSRESKVIVRAQVLQIKIASILAPCCARNKC